MYYYALFTLSKERPSTHIVFFIYIHALKLLLAITSFSKKISLVILSIMRRKTRPESIKKPTIEPAIRPKARSGMGPGIRLATWPGIKPATKFVTEPKNAKKISTRPATGLACPKRLLSN